MYGRGDPESGVVLIINFFHFLKIPMTLYKDISRAVIDKKYLSIR